MSRTAARTRPATTTPAGADTAARALVAASLLGSAVVHTLVVGEHLEEWLPAGLFFIVLVLVETVLAVAVLHRWSRTVGLAVVVSGIGTVAVWALSRSTGLPVGPEAWTPEPVGVPDVACCLVELLGAAVCGVLLTSRAPVARLLTRGAVLVGAVVVVGATAWGIGGTLGEQGHHHAAAAGD
jgi:hypothetical protein